MTYITNRTAFYESEYPELFKALKYGGFSVSAFDGGYLKPGIVKLNISNSSGRDLTDDDMFRLEETLQGGFDISYGFKMKDSWVAEYHIIGHVDSKRY